MISIPASLCLWLRIGSVLESDCTWSREARVLCCWTKQPTDVTYTLLIPAIWVPLLPAGIVRASFSSIYRIKPNWVPCSKCTENCTPHPQHPWNFQLSDLSMWASSNSSMLGTVVSSSLSWILEELLIFLLSCGTRNQMSYFALPVMFSSFVYWRCTLFIFSLFHGNKESLGGYK